MEKIIPWPQVSDEIKAHAVSLVIGRYFGTPTLLSRFNLSDWLAMVALFLECETQKLVASYGERLPEIPVTQAGPVLAEDLIHRWKTEPVLQEKFRSFLDFLEDTERKIEAGMNIDNREP